MSSCTQLCDYEVCVAPEIAAGWPGGSPTAEALQAWVAAFIGSQPVMQVEKGKGVVETQNFGDRWFILLADPTKETIFIMPADDAIVPFLEAQGARELPGSGE